MWLIVIGSLALLLLLVLLFAPWRVICRWRGGLVDIRLRFLGMSFSVWKRDVFERPESIARDGPGDSGKFVGDWIHEVVRRFEALLDHRDVLMRTARLVLRLARRFRGWWHLEDSTIEVVLGLGNPAHTGVALGALSAFSGMIEARWPKLHISVRANFDTMTLHCRGEVIFRIRAWDPVGNVTRTLVSLPWRGLWKLRRDFVYQ